jgi:hypothetical protein
MDLLEGVGGNFDVNFVMKRIPRRQTVHSLVNKRRSTGLLLCKKQEYERRVPTEEKLDDRGQT